MDTIEEIQMKSKFIIIDEKDNCATSLDEIEKDTKINVNGNLVVEIREKIPFGHKFAINDIKKGQHVKKYNQIIGIATMDINKGEWVHTHNIKSAYLEEIVK